MTGTNTAKNTILTTTIIDFILIATGLLAGANHIFIILTCVWATMMIDAYKHLYQQVLLFSFGLVFFLFLMGRDFLEQYGLHSYAVTFSSEINEHTYICELISLLCIWITYIYFIRNNNKGHLERNSHIHSEYYILLVRKFSKTAFYLTLPFAFFSSILVAIFVIKTGYTNFYMNYGGILSSSPILYFCDKIGIINAPSLCIFMSTLPDKREFKKMCIWYLIYLAITLGSGRRGEFLLGLMLLFVFFVYMQNIKPKENWFNKKYLKWGILFVPVIAIMSVSMKSMRSGEKIEEINVSDGLTDFFYQQGVSAYVIKRTFQYEKRIPKPISGYYTLQFLYSGIPARLLGHEIYSGYTVDHALKGNSLTFALAYTMMGDGYLGGRGTGSSYIAELYYDFGYLGVALGSILYGFLFSLLNTTRNITIFKRSIIFIIITSLLWAPRDSFTGFLSLLFSPSIILLLIFVFGLAKLKSQNMIPNNRAF